MVCDFFMATTFLVYSSKMKLSDLFSKLVVGGSQITAQVWLGLAAGRHEAKLFSCKTYF